MAVLFFDTMRYSLKEPRHPASDRLVLSKLFSDWTSVSCFLGEIFVLIFFDYFISLSSTGKGHSAPILYAAWAEAGLFPQSDLLNLRKIDSDLEGHPTPRLNFVDVATGSLGQGLSCAAGMAVIGKYFDKTDFRTYCLIGDGESAEGSIWEAMAFASYYKLDNLCAIFDVNRLGQSEPTALQHQMDVYEARCRAFGFEPIVVDGHDVNALVAAFAKAAATKDRPSAIIAQTYKGKGKWKSFIANHQILLISLFFPVRFSWYWR